MHLGVHYYPEHWPRERWPEDARMMAEAGVTSVRMGEFAWSVHATPDGRLDFGWLQEAIEVMAGVGIKTLLCTCSRTPPLWMLARHPEMINTAEEGSLRPHDQRYSVGLLHAAFRERAEHIDRAVITHFAPHPAVHALQIDNEVGAGNDCYCATCRQHFGIWLRQRYGSIEALNEAWGAHVWGFTAATFDDLPAARVNPALRLAYRQFMSQVNIDFAAERAAWIRAAAPEKPITSNYQNLRSSHTDTAAFGRVLDVPGFNNYHLRSAPAIVDLYRQGGDAVWVLEQFTRLGEVDAGPGDMRLHAWHAIARGATGLWFYRWRQARWGREQFGDGILPHAGFKNWRYRQLQRLGEELQRLGHRLDDSRVPAAVAILHSYRARFAIRSHHYGLPPALDIVDGFEAAAEALDAAACCYAACDPLSDLQPYRLLLAPNLFSLDEAEAEALRDFVEAGGTLVLGAPAPAVDCEGKAFDLPRPGPLQALAGVRIASLQPIATPHAIASDEIDGLAGGQAIAYADELELDGAEVLARYADGWRREAPLITRQRHAAGGAVYCVAAKLDGRAQLALTRYLMRICALAPVLELEAGLLVRERRSATERLLFIFNFAAEAARARLSCPWRDALSDGNGEGEGDSASVAVIEVAGRELRVIAVPSPGPSQ